MSVAPIVIQVSLKANPDGALRTTNASGDFNPAPTTLAVDMTALNAALGSLTGLATGGSAFAFDFRGAWLSGTDAATCTFGVRTVAGSDAAAHNWSFASSSSLGNSLVSGSIGLGTLEPYAIDSAGHELSLGQRLWSVAAPVGGTDTLAPSIPTGVSAKANPAANNSIIVGFDASTDITLSNGTPPSGVDHYNVKKADGTVAATVAAVLSKLGVGTLFNIGAVSPAPTVVQSGKQFTVTSAARAGFGGAPEEFAFYAWNLAGAQSIVAKVNSYTSAQPLSAMGLMVREQTAQGSTFAFWYLQPSTPGNGLQLTYRTTAGGNLAQQNITADPQGSPITGPVWLKIERSADLSTLRFSYALDGDTWVLAFTLSIAMQQTLWIGLGGASLQSGTSASAILQDVSLTNAAALSATFSATVTDSYSVEAVDVAGNVSARLTGVSATPTVPAAGGTIAWGAHIGAFIGNLGGKYASADAAIADWTTQARLVANKNASRLVTRFEVAVNVPLIFPTSQGDWAHAQGITLFTRLFQMLATLPNQPPGGYVPSVQLNMVANTYGRQTIDLNTAKGFCAPWWYDNTAYGPVSGDNHGGIYWGSTAAGLMTLRFWNAAVMNELRQCMAAINTALAARGYAIYAFDPTMEVSNAAAMRNAGYSDAAWTNVLAGTTGIPNGFALDLRAAMPASLLRFRTTFPVGLSSLPAMLAAVYAAKWSGSNYDSPNEVKPADLSTARTGCAWIDLAHRGQVTVGGPVVTTNFKALGNDFHCNLVADELGANPSTAAVPNAIIGCGRLPDYLVKCAAMAASHLTFNAQAYAGPQCNTIGTYANQPANYKYPAGGSTVTSTNIIDYLVALNALSFLNTVKPAVLS